MVHSGEWSRYKVALSLQSEIGGKIPSVLALSFQGTRRTSKRLMSGQPTMQHRHLLDPNQHLEFKFPAPAANAGTGAVVPQLKNEEVLPKR